MQEMVQIEESGVTFEFLKEDVFQIEKSECFKNLGDGFKVVEFIYKQNNSCIFLEAKSSIPKKSSTQDYIDFWEDITEKFINSIQFYCLSSLKRNQSRFDELPLNMQDLIWQNLDIKFLLVIPNIPRKFSATTSDIFRQKIKKIMKLWLIKDIDVQVVNKDYAKNLKILKEEA